MALGKAEKDCEVLEMAVRVGRLISVSVRETKPSVSAAWRSWAVMSLMRVGKFAREIRGMVRVV